MKEASKATVEITREVIFCGRYCHAACIGLLAGGAILADWCGYFRRPLYVDRRTSKREVLRCRQCRAATRGRDG
jgi:hypothetical protein